jgi:hypothetical protein
LSFCNRFHSVINFGYVVSLLLTGSAN